MKTIKDDQVKFVYYSIRERMAFNQLTTKLNLVVTEISEEDSNESWDVVFRTNKGQTCVSEIKVRRKSSTDFPDWLFEKKKYDGLMNVVAHAGNLKVKPVFITFLNDCVLMWDISHIKPEDFNSQELRATSVNGNQETKQKDVVYLNIKDAIKIDYQIDMAKLDLRAKYVFEYKYQNNNINLTNL